MLFRSQRRLSLHSLVVVAVALAQNAPQKTDPRTPRTTLVAMTIRVVTDSACDLPQHLADEHGITIVPLTFRFGDEEFVDRASLTPKEFWARCSASPVLPQTAAPAPGQFATTFSNLAAQGATGILVVTISAELSATLQAAEQGAKQAGLSIPVQIGRAHV